MRSNASTMVKTYSCGYPRNLGRPSPTRLPFVSTTNTVTVELAVCCSVVLVVSPLVSLIMEAVAE